MLKRCIIHINQCIFTRHLSQNLAQCTSPPLHQNTATPSSTPHLSLPIKRHVRIHTQYLLSILLHLTRRLLPKTFRRVRHLTRQSTIRSQSYFTYLFALPGFAALSTLRLKIIVGAPWRRAGSILDVDGGAG